MTKPFPYQLRGVRRLEAMGGRGLLADEPGLGKTLQALLFAARNPSARPAVVVCPASLKWQWAAEAARHIGMRSMVLEGRTPERGEGLGMTPPLTIVNYDILSPWMDYLIALRPKLVVVDEAHLIAGRTTLRAKATRHLCQGVPHVLALTGTPLVNRPAELWPTLNLIRPDLFPSFFPFAMKFCSPRRTPWGWDFSGAGSLDDLHRTLKPIMVRRRKADVLRDLPPKRRSVLVLDADGLSEYHKASKDFRGWLRKHSPEKLRSSLRAEALVKAGYLKRLAAQLKLPSVLDWLDGFLSETDAEKVVLFAVHRKVLRAVRDRHRQTAVLIDGSTPAKERRLAVERFQTDRRCRVFIGQIRAAGVGLNLTAASTVAFVELDWVPGVHTQAEDRCHRIGSKGSVLAHYLVARGTIEEKLAELLQRKQAVLSATMDGGECEGDLDVFDLLTQELRR